MTNNLADRCEAASGADRCSNCIHLMECARNYGADPDDNVCGGFTPIAAALRAKENQNVK